MSLQFAGPHLVSELCKERTGLAMSGEARLKT